MRGARVQAISSELCGERIDIVLWDDSPAQLVINALAPAEIASIVLDEDTHTMEVAVNEEQLSQSIGRNGQNVKLASHLTGWTINVMTEEQAAKKSATESQNILHFFMEQLEVDEDIAQILVREGFTNIEEVAYVADDEMLEIEEFDEEIVEALKQRANDILLALALTGKDKVARGGLPAQDLLALEGMDGDLAKQLAANGIITQEDLAELGIDDLLDVAKITREKAASLIMKAREPWFE
jgi:transcription termination/antitermination protein NusA